MALSIDGHVIQAAGAFGGSNSSTITLTTTKANSLVVVVVGSEKTATTHQTVTSVTATGLTFTKRSSVYQDSVTGAYGTTWNTLEVWSAPATATQAAKVITITVGGGGTVDCGMCQAFGVNFDLTNMPVWSANVALPRSTTSTGTSAPTHNGAATNANAMFLAFANSAIDTNQTAGSGFTLIDSNNNPNGAVAMAVGTQYKLLTGAQSSQTATFGTSWNTWGIILDAIEEPGGGGAVSANPTGVAGTSAAGTATISGKANLTLTGASATAAAGTPTISAKASTTITGVNATASPGNVTISAKASTSVTGVAGTAAAGTPTVTGLANVSLTGSSATAAAGAVTVTVGGATSVSITGVAATAAAGTPSVTALANVTLTGIAATSAVGTITTTAAASASVTGVAATSAANVPTVAGTANVTLASVLATVAAGDITVSVPTGVNVSLTGIAATAQIGDLTYWDGDEIPVTPTGTGGSGFATGPYTGAFRSKRKKKKTEDEELAELAEQLRAIPRAPRAADKPPVIYDRPLVSAFFEQNKTVRKPRQVSRSRQDEDDELAASLLLL